MFGHIQPTYKFLVIKTKNKNQTKPNQTKPKQNKTKTKQKNPSVPELCDYTSL